MRLPTRRILFSLELRPSERTLRLGAALTPREALVGRAVVVIIAGGVRLARAAWDLLPPVSLADLDLLDAEILSS